MTNLNTAKCDCGSCACVVSLESAVIKDGKHYCSSACANGHPNGQKCGNSSCNCAVS